MTVVDNYMMQFDLQIIYKKTNPKPHRTVDLQKSNINILNKQAKYKVIKLQ